MTCHYCGSERYGGVSDHVVPRRWGGSDRPTNRVSACRTCNVDKGALDPVAWYFSLARRGGGGSVERRLLAFYGDEIRALAEHALSELVES